MTRRGTQKAEIERTSASLHLLDRGGIVQILRSPQKPAQQGSML